MYNGGDAAEQIVRLSLEGFQVAAKITGEAAKNIAMLLISVLRQEQKTKGKARLTNMIKSGKELKVFSVEQKDLSKFKEQAKKYGVLYTVLREKGNKDQHAVIDIIARAEDASKIQRIMDRFELACVDRGKIVTAVEKDMESKKKKSESKDNAETESDEKSEDDDFYKDIFGDDEPETEKAEKEPAQKADTEVDDSENPFTERTESPLSEQSSTDTTQLSDKGIADKDKKESVKSKLNDFKKAAEKQKSDKSKILDVAKGEHQIPKPNIKIPKER
ncbi:MAG: PcfB family protein [Acetobacter sp.]|nr:PcfB family protein [Bacteroides sp.]MCM1341865.1 PcfB family protein [Acetobacter sp.]MCM1433162.1 PcfB family protein [Clostridiales bacterium]